MTVEETVKPDNELSVSESKDSTIKDEEDERIKEDLIIKTFIQLQKEPGKSIIKNQGAPESLEELERWNAALKLLTFLGINFEKSSHFLTQTSSFLLTQNSICETSTKLTRKM